MTPRLHGYLLAFIGGAAGLLAIIAMAVTVVDATVPQHLPPPAISNRISFDEKLRFIRQHPRVAPRVLAVGSSITARHFDASQFVKTAGLRPEEVFNGGTWGLQINQTRFTVAFYLSQFDHIEDVYTYVAPADFENCSTTPTRFFNTEDAAAYAFERQPLPRFYIRYFYLSGLLREARYIADERQGEVGGSVGRLFMDAFGSMPLLLPAAEVAQRGLYYGTPALDAACFAALRGMADDLAMGGIRFTVVVNPISPAFATGRAGGGAYVRHFVASLQTALAGSDAAVIDAHALKDFHLADFTDAYHLQWPAAQRLSRWVAEQRPVPERHSLLRLGSE